MNRRKVGFGAGVVIGMIAACSGAGVEAVGDAMVDAGEMLADAGEMLADAGLDSGAVLADAGEMIEDAGHVIKDAGRDVGPDNDADAQEPGGDGLPRAHWILRDKNGEAVQADVYPKYTGNVTKFSAAQPSCVDIWYHGNRSIGLGYSLATGSFDGCTSFASADDWPSSVGSVFADAQCEGPAYSTNDGNGTSMLKVGPDYYYVDGPPSATAPYYVWDRVGTSSICSPADTGDIWVYKPVPADVVNLLPNPPYSLELAY